MDQNHKNQAQKKVWLSSKELLNRTVPGHEKELKKLHALKEVDSYNNLLHLSAYSGLINDPNGLHRFGEKYHIFYQWSPFVPTHLNKHWGHFVTSDFINYTHTGVAIIPVLPEEINGAFSGGALVYNDKSYLFYTGNVKPDKSNDATRTAFTIEGEWDRKTSQIKNKKVLFEVNKSKYTGHFRDPKPFIRDGKFYLLHAAQTKAMTGALVLYESNKVDSDYVERGAVKIVPEITSPGYMWECPDYFSIGNDEFLVFSTQGKTYFSPGNENRDTVIALRGKWDLKNNTFYRTGDMHILDHGFDFYAPQTFANSNEIIMLGWAGMNEDSYATFDHMWAHNLTIPRVISYYDNRLYLTPHPAYEKLRSEKKSLTKKIYDLKTRQSEFDLKINSYPLTISLVNKMNHNITININNYTITVDRSQMSAEQSPDSGYVRTRQVNTLITSLKLIIDASLIEIYLNNGEFVFTSKYFVSGDLSIQFSSEVTGEFYKLRPLEIDWHV